MSPEKVQLTEDKAMLRRSVEGPGDLPPHRIAVWIVKAFRG